MTTRKSSYDPAAMDREQHDFLLSLLRTAAAGAVGLGQFQWVPSGSHVLDLGCGTGVTTLHLARTVGAHGRVVGVDNSSEMIETECKRTIAENGGVCPANCSFALCDLADPAAVEAAGLRAGAFDLVIARNAIEHMQQPVETLRMVRRLLRRGGSLHTYSTQFVGDSPMTDDWERFWWTYRIDGRDYRGAKSSLLVPGFLHQAGFMQISREERLHVEPLTELLGKVLVMLCSPENREIGLAALREQLTAYPQGFAKRITMHLDCIARNPE